MRHSKSPPLAGFMTALLVPVLVWAGPTSPTPNPRDRLLRSGFTITKPDLPFVDAIPFWSDPTAGQSGVGADGDADSSGSGSGSGAGGGTEYTQKGARPGQDGAGQGDGGDLGNLGDGFGDETPGGSGVVKLPRFYPMCLFIDQVHSSATGNLAIKGMVDAAAKCNVALIVFPFTVQYTGEFPDYINNAQRQMCNIPQAGIAPAASASTCASGQYPDNRMCNDPKPGGKFNDSIAGCAELRAARVQPVLTAKEKEEFDAEVKKEGISAGGAGGVAVSIEDVNSCNATTIGHEALGHSQFGHPNGASSGNGIGIRKGVGGGDGWTAEGCMAMFANAFENDGRWAYDPNRTRYYTRPKNPKAWKDFSNPEPIFKPLKNVALRGPSGELETPQGTRLDMIDDVKPQVASDTEGPKSKQGVVMEDGEDERHRRQGLASILFKRLQAMLTGEAEDEGEGLESADGTPRPPPESQMAQKGGRLEFDDSAPKNFRSSGSGGTAATSADPLPAGMSATGDRNGTVRAVGSDRLTFNDDAPKTPYGGGASASSSAPPASSSATYGGAGPMGAVAGAGAPASTFSSGALDGDEFFDGDRRKKKRDGSERSSPRSGRSQREPAAASGAGRQPISQKAPRGSR